MRNYLDDHGFGDRAAAEGEAIEVPADVQARMRAAERTVADVWREQDEAGARDDEPSPMLTAVAAAGVAGFTVAAWFLLLSLCGAGHWSAAEVTAPVWGLVLVGAAATLAVAVVLGTLDAWDAHCLRRADRRDRRP